MSSAAPLHDVVDADEEAVASAHDNGDVIPSEEGKCGLCQKLFIDSGNDKKVLHLMSIGVSADNENVEPLCSFERVSDRLRTGLMIGVSSESFDWLR